MHYLFWKIPRRIVHRALLHHQALRNSPSSINLECARDRLLMGRAAHLSTIVNPNALSVLADPSADNSPRSFWRVGTSKLFFITQFRMRSGQAVMGRAAHLSTILHPNALSVLAGPCPERLLHLLKKATLEVVDK